MRITFSDKTELPVYNFVYDQMSDWIFVYIYTDDFNSLVPIFRSEDRLREITVDDHGEIRSYSGYVHIEQFFGIVKEDQILVTVVLKKE